MTESIIVALITAGASVICQLLISRKDRHKSDIEEAKRDQSVKDRLASIETKLDIHNGYAEKLADITTDIAVIRTEIKNLGGVK